MDSVGVCAASRWRIAVAGRFLGSLVVDRVKGRKRGCQIERQDMSTVYTVNGAGHSLGVVVKGERRQVGGSGEE